LQDVSPVPALFADRSRLLQARASRWRCTRPNRA